MSISPVSSNDRLPFLDVLRGFSITGVLLAYILWNLGNAPASTYTAFDNILNTSALFIVDQKFYTLDE